MKNFSPLVSAIVDAFLLLEHSGEDEIDPDTAVRGMENITSSLLKLDLDDQLSLRSELLKIADSSSDSSYREFVRSLPEMIGLAGAEP